MNKQLMSGTSAIGEAAIQAGCRFYFGYPITPQNELPEYMAKRLAEVPGGVFIQAESEIGAINMVLGASAVGGRAMTSSSSPGDEFEAGGDFLPGRPGTARGHRQRGARGARSGSIYSAQSDYFQATRGGGHGDYRTIVLAPASVQELADMTAEAFDLADTYRTPVIVLADGVLGQMMEPVKIPAPRKEGERDAGLYPDRRQGETIQSHSFLQDGPAGPRGAQLEADEKIQAHRAARDPP